MKNLSSALENIKFDIRMIDIYKKSKTITSADFEKHLKGLPDTADNSQNLDFKHEVSSK